jgi:hypothetical protein
VVLRIPAGLTNSSLYGILTLSDRPFQNVRVCRCIVLLVLQPRPDQSQAGLGCSRFARHYCGNLMLISLRRATEMFQFTRGPPSCLCVQQAVSRHYSGGVAPFGISGLIACMQLLRNVSPVSASFFGLQRLGIHLVLCVACSRVCASASLLLFGKIEERKVFSFSCAKFVYKKGLDNWRVENSDKRMSLEAGLYRPGSE